MTTPRIFSLIAVTLLLAAPVRAGGGSIDATQYLPLGAFNAWEMIDKIAWETDGTKQEHQVISVTKTSVIDGVVRYNIRTKLFQDVPDVLFQFGVDVDTLYLYGVQVLIPVDFIDDDDIDVKIPTIFFDQPVAVGDINTILGVNTVTPVTAEFKVKLDFGPVDESGTVFIGPDPLDGFTPSTVTARWDAVAPINTPLDPLVEGGPPQARLTLSFDFFYTSSNEEINDELEGQSTSKAVSAVMGPGLGFVEIDGTGQQKKIVNRAVAPGELLYNPADLDSFPPLASYDVDVIDVPLTTGIVIVGFDSTPEGDIGDGVMSLSDISIEHNLGGVIRLDATANVGSETAPITLVGKAKFSKKTGAVRVGLKGKTKMLEGLGKVVKFNVKTDLGGLPPAEGGPVLDFVYNAGKDPITKELITGTMQIPVTTFEPDRAIVDVNLPVDVAKVKKGVLFVNPLKRVLGSEGTIELQSSVEGGPSLFYPVTLLQKAKLKEGFPTKRKYTVIQTGTKAKLFKFAGESDTGLSITKFGGKVAGVKQVPELTDVDVTETP